MIAWSVLYTVSAGYDRRLILWPHMASGQPLAVQCICLDSPSCRLSTLSWQRKKSVRANYEVKIRSCTSLLCSSVHCHFDGVRTRGSFTILHARVPEAALHSWPAMIHQHINNHFIWYLLHNLAALMTSGSNVAPAASDCSGVLSHIQDILTRPVCRQV